jgi:hypothetical protein
LGASRGPPALPRELTNRLDQLADGSFLSKSSSNINPNSPLHHPFAVLMTSDNDTDWAHVPDHRMLVAHQPTRLHIQTGLVEGSAQLPVVREAPPTAEVAKQQPESAPGDGPKVSTDHRSSPPSTFKSKSSDTGWLRDLKIMQVAINLPRMLEAEAFIDDNATRVEIAIRLGRVVLRRKQNK